ncbi:PapD-like protein [Lasiosphaeria hispida]|uniref:PapD-like protein n=1 Tax=Lasiosphaeria hispida TaxID=260671 RepID=A0AAJ0HPM3_9PEZI|nr:PapD-like protein [Lasiosphaeria hispida]
MSVEIDPLELGFRRPFTVEVAQQLKIKNPNASPIAFKVKTTAPKQYCVRPNSGRIEPGHEVSVSVLLQAMKTEPPADARCRDKFLVQSAIITGDKEFTNVAEIWDSVEKSAIIDKKIRVIWLAPSGEEHLGALSTPSRSAFTTGVEATPETSAPPAYSSPQEETTLTSAPVEERQPEPSQELETAPSSAPVPVVAAAKAAVVDTAQDLKESLAKAEAQIALLKEQAASGLKQRKPTVAAVEEKITTAGHALAQAGRQGTEGVPVQIVAILCLISFLLAYFLF